MFNMSNIFSLHHLKNLNTYKFRKVLFYISIMCVQKIRIFFYKNIFSDLSPHLEASKLNQPIQFLGKGTIKLSGVTVGVWSSPYFFSAYAYFEAREAGAKIIVGKGTFFNNAVTIIADRTSIEIGEQCLIGTDVSITDSDFHGMEPSNRSNGKYDCLPVKIGNDVFIGNGVKILKGVTIGDGAVVGAGSVVVNDVAPMTIYAGVPAKFIRNI